MSSVMEHHEEVQEHKSDGTTTEEHHEEVKTPMGFCLKCQKSVTVQNPVTLLSKNNRTRISGSCQDCGKNVSRFISGIKVLKEAEKKM